MQEADAIISVIVPTRNRARSLRLLLGASSTGAAPVPYEIVIADNGSDDETPRLLAQWRRRGNRQVVRVVGRQVACGQRRDRGVEGSAAGVHRRRRGRRTVWLAEVWDYFSRHDCFAAQGSVVWPPEAMSDPELYALLDRYRTIVHLDLDPDTVRTKLTGANMTIRRHTFAVVGLFNEKIGPGAAGLSEDNELADRIRAHGGWIGYMSRARVIHEIDRSRLTEEYFEEYHRRQGRSRYAYKHNKIMTSILPNMAKACVNYLVYSLTGDVRRKYRAKGRFYDYSEMLVLARKQRERRPANARA